ncbi:MAG: hypothetical protein K2X81_13845, partial [Candidatus Obscuribacterales bacterium]|nr:hypothetical protein [Candidatus Obscuribacterales bacterium]
LKRRLSEKDRLGLSTGINTFDDLIRDGLEPGDLVLVFSRPAMGKSAFCHQICAEIAAVEKKTVAIFNYQSSLESVLTRIVANREQISASSLRDNLRRKDDWDRWERGVNNLKNVPLLIDAPCRKPITELIEYCRRLRLEQAELAVIFVDDIQELLKHCDKNMNEGEILYLLKKLAEETQTCIIAASQISRELESRQDKHPTLRDLRASGKSLDYFADIACALYMESYYDPECSERDLAELILLKNTKGFVYTLELSYDAKYARFNDRPGVVPD